ncbi:MAG: formyltetrahydrofolate deformylase [Burkholderiaceae bacterium]
MLSEHHFTLTIDCPDRVGIVAEVSRYIADLGGWILEANHHADRTSGRFFMRNAILASSLPEGPERFAAGFEAIATRFDMTWRLADSARPRRVAIMVSRLDHCLVDLLYRRRAGELRCEIPCVIANHDDLRGDVEVHGIPFHVVPVTPETKPAAFAETERLLEHYAIDTIVLARYMQILPPATCARYPGRIINIHHSFLPSFVGAKPYHRAFERGVKLIGATSHYVTADLDEGPIIEQDVVRVEHDDTVDDLIRYGRDVEKAVLARALRYHLEDRVLLAGHRTVVFR